MYERLIKALEAKADHLYGDEDGIIDRNLASEAVYAISTLLGQVAALQSENTAKDKEIERLTQRATMNTFVKYAMKRACEELVDTEAALSHVEAERDAAVELISKLHEMLSPGGTEQGYGYAAINAVAYKAYLMINEWRGVQRGE